MTFRGLFQVIKSNKVPQTARNINSLKKITKRHQHDPKLPEKKFKTALHLLHLNCFHRKMISHFYISSCRGRTTSKK